MRELRLELYPLRILVLTKSLSRSKETHLKYKHQMYFSSVFSFSDLLLQLSFGKVQGGLHLLVLNIEKSPNLAILISSSNHNFGHISAT